MADNPQTTGQTGMDGRSGAGGSQSAKELSAEGNRAAESGDFEAAEEAFEAAVAADPRDARARYNLALARQNLGDPEGAITSYMRRSILAMSDRLPSRRYSSQRV